MTQNGCDETFIFLSAGPWRTASPLFDPGAPGLRTTYLDVDDWFGVLELSRANTDAGGSRALARGRLHHGAGDARHRARGPVGSGGADGGEYNGSGLIFDRHNAKYVAAARRAATRVGRADYARDARRRRRQRSRRLRRCGRR